MTWKNIDRKIWQMWKHKYTLTRMAREVSKLTHWSEYLSLCHILNFLHNRKGIAFSRRQVRYAFNKLPKDEIEGEELHAWYWILDLAGYKFLRGKKSTLGHFKKGTILSYSRPKIADVGISHLERYKTITGEIKSSQNGNSPHVFLIGEDPHGLHPKEYEEVIE